LIWRFSVRGCWNCWHGLYFIENWSLWFDFYILFRTIGAVLLPKNAF
jgi:lipopolysaccharide/colanic/teichoic acid biosynthesis glycosyltransferase